MAFPFGGSLRWASVGLVHDPVQRAVGSPDFLLPALSAGGALVRPTIITPDAAVAGLNPIFSVDWTSSTSLPSQLTLSRASSGTYFDSSGILQTATSNTPRFDYKYNGTSWSEAGLLIEEQRTNLVLSSQLPASSSFTLDGVSFTTNATTSPDGAVNATKLVELATNAEHRIYQFVILAASVPCAFTFFAKKAERNWISIRSNGGLAVANFNLNTGAVGTTGGSSFISASINDVGNGWFRCVMIATSHSSGVETPTINLGDADTGTGVSYSYLGDGTSGLYSQGVQIEVGSFATSYIPTTTAAVTRSADIVSSTDAGLLAAQGWVVEVGELPGSAAATLLGINTGIGIGATSGNALTTADGGSQTTVNTGAWTGQNRGGISWDSTPRVSIDLDGGTVVTAANAPSTPTTLYFGNTNNGASGFLNGHLRMMAAYAAVSDADLPTISTVGASFSISSGPVNITYAATLGALAQAATGTVLDQATLAQILGALGQASTATVLDQAVTSQTLGALGQSATATVIDRAAVSQALGVLGQAAAGTVIDTATVAQALGVLSQAATATIADNATVAQVLGPLGQSAAATHPDNAAVAQALGALVQAATSGVLAQASALQALGALAQAATATAIDSAVVAQTLGALGQAATGSVSEAITVAQSLGALSQAAAATHPDTAAVAQTLGALVQAATAGAVDSATAAQTLGALAQAAAAAVTDEATVGQTLGQLGQTATVIAGGAGFISAQVLGALVQTLTGTAIDAATVAQSLGDLTQAATGRAVVSAVYSDTLGALGQSATGAAPVRATVAQVLGALGQIATVEHGREAVVAQVLGALQQVAAARVAESATAAQLLGALGQTARARTKAIAHDFLKGSLGSRKAILGGLASRAAIKGQLGTRQAIKGQLE